MINKKYELLVISDFTSFNKLELINKLFFSKIQFQIVKSKNLEIGKVDGIILLVENDDEPIHSIFDVIIDIKSIDDIPIWLIKNTESSVERKLYLDAGIENCLNFKCSGQEVEKVVTNLLDRLAKKDIEATNRAIKFSLRESRKKQKRASEKKLILESFLRI